MTTGARLVDFFSPDEESELEVVVGCVEEEGEVVVGSGADVMVGEAVAEHALIRQSTMMVV